jgi:predicted ferric reductase
MVLRELPGVMMLRRLLGGYERWRMLHRTTGLFLAAGFAHGLLDGSAFPPSALLRWSYVAIGGIGLAFYVYREAIAPFVVSLHDYQVASVTTIEPDLVEIVLHPLGRHMRFVPGQFAMVYLEAKDGWHRHPFTIASSPREGVLRFTVKALGDYTTRLPELVLPGMPAVVSGPHGRFDHRKGTGDQLWVAGGVGITPFLSWLRDLDHAPIGPRVDFFYTHSREDAPFREEIEAIAERHPNIRIHVVDSESQGRLTTERMLTATAARPQDLSVFLCGPEGMIKSLQQGLRRAGVGGRHIHREHFDWR